MVVVMAASVHGIAIPQHAAVKGLMAKCTRQAGKDGVTMIHMGRCCGDQVLHYLAKEIGMRVVVWEPVMEEMTDRAGACADPAEVVRIGAGPMTTMKAAASEADVVILCVEGSDLKPGSVEEAGAIAGREAGALVAVVTTGGVVKMG